MKTSLYQIDVVSLFCPEDGCHEAYYDDDGRDWSVASKDRQPGKVVTCSTCGTKFKLPGIVGRIGK